MGIFDDKEEVLDIQLTQWGKQKLSLGVFDPVYYTFDDDDVLYDGGYANLSESQNDIIDRILDETPRTKPQSAFTGIETDFKDDVSKFDKDELFLGINQSDKTRTYSTNNSLGSSKYNNKFTPAWDLRLHASEISSSSPVITGSISDIRIPQIDLKEVEYPANVIRDVPEEITDQIRAQNFESSALENEITQFSNGTIVELVNEDIFIELNEINSLFNNENFDIEVFLVEEKETNNSNFKSEHLIPLSFAQKPFIRDAIYDEEEFFQEFGDVDIDESMVEYYMDIEVDSEIPDDIFCKYIQEDERRGIYGTRRECPEIDIVLRRQIFKSDVESPDLDDDC